MHIRRFLLYSLLLTILIFNIFPSPTYAGSDDIVAEVLSIIKENYVEEVSPHVLAGSSVEDVLKRLGDSYARYMSQEEYQEQLDSLDGNFTGIGVYIATHAEGIEVVSVIKGTPAEKAGIRKQDVILSVDGKSLAGLSTEEAMRLMQGPAGSNIVIKVKRCGESFTVTVYRENIDVPTVHTELLDDGIIYMAIDDFGRRTPGEMGKAIKQLKRQQVTGWIIDLRGNPGGYLDTAIELAGYLIPDEPVVVMKDRNTVDFATGVVQAEIINGPVVVLTDEYSASAAEILAAALHDNQRALLIGKKSYGKGSIQEIFPLSNGGMLKLTVAHFYSPCGDVINGVGVSPDIDLEDENSIAAAKLILSNISPNASRLFSIEFENLIVNMDMAVVQRTANWKAWADIIDGIGESPVYYGNDSNWTELGDEEREQQWSFYYPGYEYIGEISEEDGICINMKSVLNKNYVNDFNIELINASTGERIKSDLKVVNDSTFSCQPLKTLEKGEYWLVIHDTMRFADGQRLPHGQLAIVRIP